MGIHSNEFVREIRVKENGFVKIYKVVKCRRCRRVRMSLIDVIVDTITPSREWNKKKNYNVKAVIE